MYYSTILTPNVWINYFTNMKILNIILRSYYYQIKLKLKLKQPFIGCQYHHINIFVNLCLRDDMPVFT